MTDELPAWDFDPVPTAARDARTREALLGWCRGTCAPMLAVVRDVMADGNIAGLAMSFARVYQADMYGTAGRDLTIARLDSNLGHDRATAAEEAS
jgi:hypothetical protein